MPEPHASLSTQADVCCSMERKSPALLTRRISRSLPTEIHDPIPTHRSFILCEAKICLCLQRLVCCRMYPACKTSAWTFQLLNLAGLRIRYVALSREKPGMVTRSLNF